MTLENTGRFKQLCSKKIKGIYLYNIIFVFAVTFLVPVILRMGPEIVTTLWTSEVSQYFLAAHLAGLDWTGIANQVIDTRQGYMFIFAPVLAMSSSPYFLLAFVYWFNTIIASVFAVLIYVSTVKLFGMRDSIWTVLVVIACLFLTTGLGTATTYYFAVYLVIWTVFILLLLISKANKKRNRLLLTGALILVLSYGLIAHTNLLSLIYAVAFVTVIYFLITKVWIVEPLVFYPGVAVGYYVARIFNAYTLREFFGGMSIDTAHNANVDFSTVLLGFPFSFRVFFDILVGNTYKLIISTYGIAAICIVLAFIVIYKFGKKIIKERVRSDDIGVPREHLIIFAVFGVCTAAIILAMYIRYATVVYAGYYYTTNGYMRGLAYAIYYLPFSGPLILFAASYLEKNRKEAIKICAVALLVFLPLAFYVMFSIASRAQNVINIFFLPIIVGENGILKSIIIVLSFILGYMFLSIFNKGRFYYLAFITMNLFLLLYNFSFSFTFNNQKFITREGRYVDEVYDFVQGINQDVELPDHIYAHSSGSDIQFMLSHFRVVSGYPEEKEENNIVIVTATNSDDAYEVLKEFDYEYYILAEWVIFIRGENIQEVAENYVHSLK